MIKLRIVSFYFFWTHQMYDQNQIFFIQFLFQVDICMFCDGGMYTVQLIKVGGR